MEVKRIVCKSGKIYYIVNDGNKSTLVTSWGKVGSHKKKYYCSKDGMLVLLRNILEDNLKSYITQYKEKNDITRLTSLQKDMIKAEWQQQEYTQELIEVEERIRNNDFDD